MGAHESAERVVLQGGIVVTMDPARRVLQADVVLEGGRILAIGAAPKGDEARTKWIDCRDHVVLPGFVQAHVHLGQALFRGLAEGRELLPWLRERVWPLEAAHDHQSAYWSGRLGAADCLLSGTTAIADIGLVTHTDPLVQAIDESGLRAVVGKCLMDTGVGVPPELLESTERAIDEAREVFRRWHGRAGGRIRGSLCPRFILSCSTKLWEAVALAARELGAPVHTHLLEHPHEDQEVRAVLGVGQLEYLDRLGLLDTDFRIAHAVQFQAEHADLLAGRTLRVAHCPSANLKLGSGIADLVRLRATPGIVVGIGCDGAPCNNDMDVLEEVRLAALLQSIRQGPGHFGAMEALELATIEGARAIGWEDEIGSLEPGKAADVVVLDLRKPASFGASSVSMYDRIVYGTARDAVAKVYVAGRELVADGRLVGVDMPELLKRSTESIDAIVRRARL